METSVEQIIRKKLDVALIEAKKKVGARLFELTTAQPNQMTATPPNAGAKLAASKQKKTLQIQAMQDALTAMKTKASQSKNPAAMTAAIQAKQQKLNVAKQELSAIK